MINALVSSNKNGLFVIWGYKNADYLGHKQFESRILDLSPTEGFLNGRYSVTLNNENVFKDSRTGITIGPIIKSDANGITFNIKIE